MTSVLDRPTEETVASTTACVTRAEDAYLWDASGRRLLDATSGRSGMSIGHGRAELAGAAARQLRSLDLFAGPSGAHPLEDELAGSLGTLVPGGTSRLRLTSGSHECELVVRRVADAHARALAEPWRRSVVRLRLADRAPSDLTPGAVAARTRAEVLHSVEAVGQRTVVALWVDLVQDGGGATPTRPGLLQGVRDAADHLGALLVVDETRLSPGRTGEVVACRRHGVAPDVLVLGPGLASGCLPAGAVLVGDHVRGWVDVDASTGHPLAAALALATLDVLDREGLPEHVRRHEAALAGSLRRLLDLPVVADVQGAGYLWSVVLHEPRDAPARRRLIAHLTRALPAAGLLAHVETSGPVSVVVAPPLVIGPDEIDLVGRALHVALEDA